MKRYIKFFQSESDAHEWAEMKNLVASNDGDIYVVTDGPSENFAVMDFKSFRELRA